MAWHVFTSGALLTGVLLGLAALLLLAAWLPQAPSRLPPTAGQDLAAYARWLTLAQKRFGSTYTLIQSLGLLSINNTWLFRGLISLLGCALAARLVDKIEHTWGRRPAWADVAGGLAGLGGLLLLTGLAVSATWGWHTSPLPVGIGQSTPVGQRTLYSIRLDKLQTNAAGQVSLLQETEPIATGSLAPGRAVRSHGLSIHLQAVVPAVRASATLSDSEQPLPIQTSAAAAPVDELLLPFTPDKNEQVFAAPEAGLVVRLAQPQAARPIQALLYRMQPAQTLFEGELPADGRLQTENITFDLKTEPYALLVVAYDPGNWLTAGGWLLSGLGLLGGRRRPR